MTWTAFSLFLLAVASFLFLAQYLLPRGFGIALFGGGQGTRRRPISPRKRSKKARKRFIRKTVTRRGRRPLIVAGFLAAFGAVAELGAPAASRSKRHHTDPGRVRYGVLSVPVS
jgi:hypothetical protein